MSSMTPSLARTHRLLAVQTLVVLLVSINRLGGFTSGYVASNEFLRWVDLINMLPLPLLSLGAFYLLKEHLAYESAARGGAAHRALGLAFLIGAYLLGASYGTHEVTNYLHQRFCLDDASTLCRIVAFQDDDFSHWVFFTGFLMVNVSLLWLQLLFPHRARLQAGDIGLLALNGAFIGLGVFANLAFEEIGLDLYVVAALALISAWLLLRRGAQPLVIYYLTAYGLGSVATALYKMAAG
jgi:hypothetical protein